MADPPPLSSSTSASASSLSSSLLHACLILESDPACSALMARHRSAAASVATLVVLLLGFLWWRRPAPPPQARPAQRGATAKDARGLVCVVTGANRGIGLEVVRQLSALLAGAAGPDSPTATVILCSRSAAEGAAAAAALNAALTTARAKSLGAGAESSVVVVPQQLDVTSVESCVRLSSKVCSGYGGIDVLINNAGFAHHLKTGYEQARTCVDVNFLGTMNVLASLLPLAQPGARFINVSSTVGQIGRRGGSDGDSDGDRTSSGGGGMGGCPLAVGAGGKGGQLSAELRRKLLAPDLTVEGLTALVETFVEQAKRGEENNTVYGGAGSCGDGEGVLVHRSAVLEELCGMVGGGLASRPVARTVPGPDHDHTRVTHFKKSDLDRMTSVSSSIPDVRVIQSYPSIYGSIVNW